MFTTLRISDAFKMTVVSLVKEELKKMFSKALWRDLLIHWFRWELGAAVDPVRVKH